VQLPVFLVGLAVYISFALLMAFFRATYVDFWGVILCVAMMSISTLFYIIGGQVVSRSLEPGADLGLFAGAGRLQVPGAAGGDRTFAGIGSGARWYRTIFLEEMGKDYVRTARAKGLSEATGCSGTSCTTA